MLRYVYLRAQYLDHIAELGWFELKFWFSQVPKRGKKKGKNLLSFTFLHFSSTQAKHQNPIKKNFPIVKQTLMTTKPNTPNNELNTKSVFKP